MTSSAYTQADWTDADPMLAAQGMVAGTRWMLRQKLSRKISGGDE